jgi:hypothetical protein
LTWKARAVINATMKKGWLVVLALFGILGGLVAWYPSRKPDAVAASGMKSDTPGEKQEPESTPKPVEGAPKDPEETNQRTRPSQPPPERTYIKPQPEIPVAEPLKDKPGFVVSPYNNKIVDVKDIPKGTLVADPSFPPEEKKYFRVP